MAKAIFFDRDGTLNEEVDVLRDVAQLRVLPGVSDALKKLRDLGFLLIVVTNQPVIARGWLTRAQVEEIHDELLRRLNAEGATIDKLYYCPHHPNANLPEYRVECECRKPNIGLIEQACAEFDIDPAQSFFVGDSTSDILAGNRATLTTILVETGYAGKDGKYNVVPDFIVKDLSQIVNVIARSEVTKQSFV